MREPNRLQEEMKRDLMKVYREECEKYGGHMQQAIYERTIKHPAPRFYVDARRAHQRISPMMRGDRSQIEKMTPLRREMYEALFSIVVDLSQKERFWGKSVYCILRQAVMEPAPRFYINVRRMDQIWHEQTGKERLMRKEMEEKRKVKMGV